MPESLLTALKLVFLGLLYLFFLRVIRAVWVELREPKNVQLSVPAPSAAPPPRAAPAFAGVPARPFWGGGHQAAAAAAAAPDRLVIVSPGGTSADFGQVFE